MVLVMPVESSMLLRSNWQDSRSQNVVINPKSAERHRGDVTENGKMNLKLIRKRFPGETVLMPLS